MNWIGVGVAVFYLIIFFLSRKESGDGATSMLLRPFYRMAVYLYKRVCVWRLPVVGSRQVEKDLQRLYPGEGKEQLCTNYYVKKIALSLVICLAGTFLGVVVSAQARQKYLLDDEGAIARGTYAEKPQELEVTGRLETGERSRFQISVEAKRLNREEAEEVYEEFAEKLPLLILGDNPSLQEVTGDLLLEETFEGYPFSVEWKSSRPALVSSTGTVASVESEETVVLQVLVWYEELEWQTELELRVLPPTLSEEEQRYRGMEEMLVSSEEETRAEAKWKLPEDYLGQKVIWKQVVEDNSLLLWVGGLVVAVLVFLFADKDLHDKLENRKTLMKRSYPDMVQKLVLYLGAGLTVRAAFGRIATEYEKGRKEGKRVQPVYEEMLYTCRELQAGVSEGAAYEHFGKRTGLQEYIRLSTLLMQNLKKGNSTLLQRLKEEADRACIEQLQNSRRLGEEAVTKLLLPMVMLLLVVMLIIMIPAFSSAGI